MALHDIAASDAGSLVRVEGFLKHVRRLSTGSLTLTLTDLVGEVDVFIRSGIVADLDPGSLVPGAYLSVQGEVAVYRGDLEIDVISPEHVRLIVPAGMQDIPVETLVSVPESFRGMRVSTRGEISFIREARGNLTILATDPSDPKSEILILVEKGINGTIIYRDIIDVYGEFTYGYTIRAGWRVVVNGPGHDVSRNDLSSAPPPVTLGDLLSDPERYANTSVHLAGLLVLRAQDVSGTGFRLVDGEASISGFIFWYRWTRSDIIEGDIVRFTGVVGYHPARGEWRLTSDAPSDLTRV